MNNQPGTNFNQQQRALLKAQTIALEIRQVMETPPPAGEEDDRVIRTQSRLDEFADVLLDLSEPKRTEVFRVYLELREMVDVIVRRQQG